MKRMGGKVMPLPKAKVSTATEDTNKRTYATIPIPGVLENNINHAIGRLATVDTALSPYGVPRDMT
jgi:hypothetical protein